MKGATAKTDAVRPPHSSLSLQEQAEAQAVAADAAGEEAHDLGHRRNRLAARECKASGEEQADERLAPDDQLRIEIQAPMGVVILGGLLSSTALNMLVLPALYARFARGRTS